MSPVAYPCVDTELAASWIVGSVAQQIDGEIEGQHEVVSRNSGSQEVTSWVKLRFEGSKIASVRASWKASNFAQASPINFPKETPDPPVHLRRRNVGQGKLLHVMTSKHGASGA